MILLDTNVISEPMRPNPDPKVLAWLDAQAAESLYLATVSLAELLLGIERLPAGKRRKALAAALHEQIIALFGKRIVPFDLDAAETYAQIVTRARRHGHPIAVADAQIAAIAASRQLTVATRDEAPFQAAGVPAINPWTASIEGRWGGAD
ncbi:MAG TPA: type II toxin-antitoxin system VapC family toxin [Terriglobia bacterium]|nr:type II toxin-antitoxin system VapC family toxin [Terriglobia bacterium]